MASDEQPTRAYQFGLRHVIIAMVVLSMAFALLLAAPNWVANATAIMMTAVGSAGFTAAVVYGHGNIRAFSIGALPPVVMACVPSVILLSVTAFEGLDELNDPSGMRWLTFGWTIASIITGGLSVVVRWRLSDDV